MDRWFITLFIWLCTLCLNSSPSLCISIHLSSCVCCSLSPKYAKWLMSPLSSFMTLITPKRKESSDSQITRRWFTLLPSSRSPQLHVDAQLSRIQKRIRLWPVETFGRFWPFFSVFNFERKIPNLQGKKSLNSLCTRKENVCVAFYIVDKSLHDSQHWHCPNWSSASLNVGKLNEI